MTEGMRLDGDDQEYEQALAEAAGEVLDGTVADDEAGEQDAVSTAPPDVAPPKAAPAPVVRVNPLQALRRRQAALRARVTQQSAPAGLIPQAAEADGLPAAPPAIDPVRQLVAALNHCADKGGGDAIVARTLWDWALKRAAKLDSVGYANLARRWEMVVHGLGSAVAFTKDEWRPR